MLEDFAPFEYIRPAVARWLDGDHLSLLRHRGPTGRRQGGSTVSAWPARRGEPARMRRVQQRQPYAAAVRFGSNPCGPRRRFTSTASAARRCTPRGPRPVRKKTCGARAARVPGVAKIESGCQGSVVAHGVETNEPGSGRLGGQWERHIGSGIGAALDLTVARRAALRGTTPSAAAPRTQTAPRLHADEERRGRPRVRAGRKGAVAVTGGGDPVLPPPSLPATLWGESLWRAPSPACSAAAARRT